MTGGAWQARRFFTSGLAPIRRPAGGRKQRSAPFVCLERTFVPTTVPICYRGFIPVTEIRMTAQTPDDPKPDDLDFDHKSPDLEDPQVDPPAPAEPPADKHSTDDYPPYNTTKE